MILVRSYLFWRNKRKCLGKVLISEVEHTRYNTTYTTDDLSKEEIAKLVSDIIMDEYENVVITRCVRENYNFLEPGELQGVTEMALAAAKDKEGEGFLSYEKRKEAVYKSVYEYLNENNSIVPRGFVDFRFRNLYFWAEAIVALGADLYFDKREYEEFTCLLSMFVASRESKEEVIHIIWQNSEARLYNKRGRDVTKKYRKDFLNAAKKENLTQDDLTISGVIAAAPERLVLHCPPKSPLVEALKKIYLEKCKICSGCNVCKML